MIVKYKYGDRVKTNDGTTEGRIIGMTGQNGLSPNNIILLDEVVTTFFPQRR